MSRFQASLYKNQLPVPAKRECWHTELSLSSSVHDSSNGLAAAWLFSLAPSGSKGRLSVLDYDKPAKHAQQAPTLSACSGDVLDLDTAFYSALAVSSDDAKLSVFRIPASAEEATATQSFNSIQLETAASQIRFHPHASSLLCALSGSTLSLYDVEASKRAHLLQGPAKGLWSAAWSTDGKTVASTSKDGMIQLWDARTSSDAQTTATGHQGIKASRVAWVGDQIFTTGFSKMRDREYALRDPRNLDKPVKVQRLDTGTGILIPLVDNERQIVYLAGRGDMVLRWTEISSTAAVFSDGPLFLGLIPDEADKVGSAPLPVPVLGATFAPREGLDIMHTEINRLLISGKEGVVLPVSIGVPRKQYLDFYSELFPAQRLEVPAQRAPEWLAGSNKTVELRPVDPSMQKKPVPIFAAAPSLQPAPSGAPGEKQSDQGAPVASLGPVAASVETSQAATPTASESTTISGARTNGATTTSSRSAAAHFQQPAKPWSRNFLSGKTPLKPDYDGLSGLAPSSASDTHTLRANSRLLIFPLAGAGGRLGVQTVKRKGRLPTLIPAVATGQAVHDFVLDPFDEQRLFVAGGDGHIRIFRLPPDGLEEGHDLTEAESAFGGDGIDRIIELHCHPTASDLLSTLSDDQGTTRFRVWNTESRQCILNVPLEGKGVFASAWSRNGRLIALACRDKKLRVLDPRSKTIVAEVDSHASTRPSRPVWLDEETHILTTGFNMASNRELRVYKLEDNSLKRTASATLDASPAPLVPHHDPDTGIVYLYSRGERSVRAYDVSSFTALTALPSFEHGTLQQAVAFLPKRCVDVKAVEVAVAYRLSPSAIQIVTWIVPRARAEFFQDDVFPPTRDVEKPALTAEEWFGGQTLVQNAIDLRPVEMTPLSQAPATATVVSTRSKITGPVMTDSQKREQQMQRLFERARKDTDDNDLQERPGQSDLARENAPDPDDW